MSDTVRAITLSLTWDEAWAVLLALGEASRQAKDGDSVIPVPPDAEDEPLLASVILALKKATSGCA